MSKAEDYISEHTRHCSNSYWDKNDGESNFSWITPTQARKAVEIAREEMIEKFYSWLKTNATYIHPRKGIEECITTLGKLNEVMKDE